jgi:hypothetical protein
MTEQERRDSVERYMAEARETLSELSREGKKAQEPRISELCHELGNKLHGLNLLFQAGELGLTEKNRQAVESPFCLGEKMGDAICSVVFGDKK